MSYFLDGKDLLATRFDAPSAVEQLAVDKIEQRPTLNWMWKYQT